VTRLRQLMLDELQRRNCSSSTIYSYIHAVEDFARYFGRSPYRLGPDHIQQYQAHLLRDRKLLAGTVQIKTSALRFLFVKTLQRFGIDRRRVHRDRRVVLHRRRWRYVH
jgi:integrase/recombinase XerD